MKVVILGSRKVLEPLEILYKPETQENAAEKCREAIDEADQIWFYLEGSGEDTFQDHQYAWGKRKPIYIIKR